MAIKNYKIEFQPSIPKQLSGLEVIADDLHYGWNAEARKLFAILDSNLWRKCKHSPKLFLRQVSQSKIDQAVLDGNYMEDYARVLSSYKA